MADQSKEKLPFDEGREAYMERKSPDSNPYAECDWKHDEWWLGWSHERECDTEDSWSWSEDKFVK